MHPLIKQCQTQWTVKFITFLAFKTRDYLKSAWERVGDGFTRWSIAHRRAHASGTFHESRHETRQNSSELSQQSTRRERADQKEGNKYKMTVPNFELPTKANTHTQPSTQVCFFTRSYVIARHCTSILWLLTCVVNIYLCIRAQLLKWQYQIDKTEFFYSNMQVFCVWMCVCVCLHVRLWPLCGVVPACSLVQVAVRWQERLGGGAERRRWAQLPGIKQWPLHNERWRQHFPLVTRFHTVTFAYSYIFPSTSHTHNFFFSSCEQDICLPDTALEERK